jgi:F-type H+-transporting ATPase subunit epsilon
MAGIPVDIVTPERRVLETSADSVVVPAVNGELGILPHHAPLLAQLAPGQIRLRTGEEIRYFSVSGGYVEVDNNRVSIFAETAEMAEEIDLERARQAAERAKIAMHTARQDADLAQAEAALRRALARLRAVEAAQRQQRRAKPVPQH